MLGMGGMGGMGGFYFGVGLVALQPRAVVRMSHLPVDRGSTAARPLLVLGTCCRGCQKMPSGWLVPVFSCVIGGTLPNGVNLGGR